MNAAGGHAFSLSMAKFLAMLDAGQDVESLFETPSEYLAAVNYITNVYLTPEVHPDKILLLAGSYHGPSVQAEYEFWVKAPGRANTAGFPRILPAPGPSTQRRSTAPTSSA